MAKSQTSIEDLADDSPPEPTGGKRASSSKGGGARKTSARERDKAEKDLHGRLVSCFQRIAGALGERGDEELAEIFEDDAEVMAYGLVSLTRPLVVLRTPLLVFVALVEPFLAFRRIFVVLVGRVAERRAHRALERELAQDDNADQPESVPAFP